MTVKQKHTLSDCRYEAKIKIVLLHTKKTHGGEHARARAPTHMHGHIQHRQHRANHSATYMEVSSQLHIPAILPQKQHTRGLVRATDFPDVWRRKTSLVPARNWTLGLPGRNILGILIPPISATLTHCSLMEKSSFIFPLSRRSTHCNVNVHVKTATYMECCTAAREPITRF